ncbi:protein Mis18-beta [Phaenicophaeus curvirostris]|uniref:protein Mis18-beta n=1 Tax=Phaenicophaeus curvirostris TaxID=33595 RepID=UPI0037F0DA9D
MVGIQGALLGCAYYVLTCQSCGSPVGFILYSAPSSLAYLRGLFCFLKGNILCYFLKNQVVIEASMVNFPAVTLKKQVEELKQRVVNAYTRIELLMEKLEELYQNINVAERQSSALDAGDLRTEHAIVRIN